MKYEILYLPEPEIPVYTLSKNNYFRSHLDKYIKAPEYYFYLYGNVIHSGLLRPDVVKDYKANNKIIPKHLLEIIEVPDV
jgi:hypothetical protein